MNLRRMIGALALAMLASALVYAVLAIVGDGPAVAAALSDFPTTRLIEMLVLALGCYFVRSLRWGALMRLAGYPVRTIDALYMHLSGQTMTISPGRVGEVFKPWLARDIAGMPMAEGIALVFSERVADLIAVAVLSLGGLSFLHADLWSVVLAILAILVGTAVAGSSWFHRLALAVLSKQRWARDHHASVAAISATVRTSLAWSALAWSVPASVLAWGLEGTAFFVCVRTLGFNGLDILALVSVYAMSTIIGAFTFLPGGIGVTEASMAGLLVAVGMPTSGAAAATLLTRASTLWWAVLLGWGVFASRPVVFRRLVATVRGADATDDADPA